MNEIETIFFNTRDEKLLLSDEIVYISTSICSNAKYVLSGNIYFEKDEVQKRALLIFDFKDISLTSEEVQKLGLSYSNVYGAYKYITNDEKDKFSVSFSTPDKVKEISIGVRRWNTKNNVYISSKLNFQNTPVSYNELRNEIKQLHDKIDYVNKNNFSQIESLLNIQNVLNIRFPLPKMRNWAISPDFAELLLKEVLIRKPENVVEFGSGVSTLIIGYALEMNKKGKLTSFEHDMYYGDKTIQNLKLHGLEKVAEVVSAPINEITINEQKCKWYSVDKTKVPAKIDILVVDGPPARTDKEARYPALPFLIDRLADDAIVIMDDGIRQEEKKICRRWLEEYSEFESEYVETEKGAFILRRKKSHHA